LSATERVAVKLAAEAGVKLTEMVQVAPASRVVPQVVAVWLKSLALAPPMLMAMPVRVAFPVLERVVVKVAAVEPAAVLGKASVAGESEAIGAGGATPAPVIAAVCGEPAALSATEMFAVKVAIEAGVKVT
jgi:hypothetical protein